MLRLHINPSALILCVRKLSRMLEVEGHVCNQVMGEMRRAVTRHDAREGVA